MRKDTLHEKLMAKLRECAVRLPAGANPGGSKGGIGIRDILAGSEGAIVIQDDDDVLGIKDADTELFPAGRDEI